MNCKLENVLQFWRNNKEFDDELGHSLLLRTIALVQIKQYLHGKLSKHIYLRISISATGVIKKYQYHCFWIKKNPFQVSLNPNGLKSLSSLRDQINQQSLYPLRSLRSPFLTQFNGKWMLPAGRDPRDIIRKTQIRKF